MSIAFQHVWTASSIDLALSIENRAAGCFRPCQLVSSTLASLRSAVSNPSVNQPHTGASQVAGLGALALVAPQPGKAGRRTQFPELCPLRLRHRYGLAEACLGLRWTGVR